MVEAAGEKRLAQSREHAEAPMRTCQAGLDLRAAAFAAHAPRTEVLAVVGEQAIAALAEPRPRALRDFRAGVSGTRGWFDPYFLASGELLDVDFLDRAAAQRRAIPRVVHDLAVADVDPVMAEAVAGRDQMSADGDQSSLMFGPTPTGWSVAIAAQKVQNRRSLSAWKTDRREMNFMPSVSARERSAGIGGG